MFNNITYVLVRERMNYIRKYRVLIAFLCCVLYYAVFAVLLRSYEFDIWDQQTWGYTAILDNPFVVHIRNICQSGISVYGPLANLYIDMEALLSLIWDRLIIKENIPICDLSQSYIIIRKTLLALIHFLFSIFLFIKILGRKDKNQKRKRFIGLLIWLFNPVSLLVGSVWGQLDEIIVILTLMCFYFLSCKRYIVSAIFLASVVLFKAQGFIVVPVYIFFLVIDGFIENSRTINKNLISNLYTKLSISGFTFFLTLFITTLPFLIHEKDLFVRNAYIDFRIFPFVHMRSFNIWMLIFGDIIQVKDDGIFALNLSYHKVGIIIFLIISLNIFLVAIGALRRKKREFDFSFMLEILYLINGTFFIFMTEIHERYVVYMYIPFLLLFIVKFERNRVHMLEYFLLSIFTIIASFNLFYVLYSKEIVNIFGDLLIDNLVRSCSVVVLYIYFFSLLNLKSNIFMKRQKL